MYSDFMNDGVGLGFADLTLICCLAINMFTDFSTHKQ